MATSKRERQRANRALKKEQEAKVERQEEVRQRGFAFGLVAVGLIAALGLFWFATRDGDSPVDTETTTEAADGTDADADSADGDADSTVGESDADDEEATATPAYAEVAVSAPEAGATHEGVTDCPAEDGTTERTTQFAEAPPMCIDPAKSYTAVLETTHGDITVELDAAKAPETVNNFVVLARYHYYDDTAFHRIIPGFVIQGGDAVGPRLGVGNPGYMIDEEPPTDPIDPDAETPLYYEVGSLAMAKGSTPKSTGSQFFIVTGEQGASLPPQYSLFGTVTDGMDAVTAIESVPTTPPDHPQGGDFPTEEVYVRSVTITES